MKRVGSGERLYCVDLSLLTPSSALAGAGARPELFLHCATGMSYLSLCLPQIHMLKSFSEMVGGGGPLGSGEVIRVEASG